MRKLLLLLAAFGMLAVTGAVSAATTTTVTITKAGYVPSAPKISQGDSVQFVNSDTAAHQIVFKTMTGITCAPNPLVLQPGQSGTCSFQNAGSTTFSDPNAKGNTFRGTVTVNGGAAESLTRLGVDLQLAEIGSAFAYVKARPRPPVERKSATAASASAAVDVAGPSHEWRA